MTKIFLSLSIFLFSNIALAGEVAQKPNMLASFLPFILIIVVFYFFIIRPQQRKLKEKAKMVNSLKIGDKVVTDSGIFGIISKINDKEGLFLVEIAKNISVKIKKQNIFEIEEKNSNSKSNSSSKSRAKSSTKSKTIEGSTSKTRNTSKRSPKIIKNDNEK
jgi:preprotein translocase subunit YajC